jgi:hypothetical protein
MIQKMIIRQVYKIAETVIFISLLIACSGRMEEVKTSDSETTSEAKNEAIFDKGLNMLKPWTSHWMNLGMTEGKSSFSQLAEMELELLERPEVNPIKEGEHPLADFQLHHPENMGTVDIYHYKVHIDKALRLSFEPDAEVIFYRENGMRERLLFIGPSGLFEDAVWVDAEHLLVVGYFENETGFSPMAWLLNINDSAYQLYESEFVLSNYDRFSYLENKFSDLNLAP